MNNIKKLIFMAPAFGLLAQPAFAGTVITFSRIDNTGVSDLGRLLSATFAVATIFAILFVFGMLILGGYGWLTAGGDKAKVEEARTRITNALIGLAIIASAWVLITLIANFFGVNFESFTIPTASERTP